MAGQRGNSSFAILGRSDARGLVANLVLAVGGAVVVNAITLAAGWVKALSAPAPSPPQDLPPDWLVGPVWVLLFGVMGLARWLVLRDGPGSPRYGASGILLFMLWCLAYPFLTDGLRSETLGLFANGISIGLNVALCLRLWPASPRAAVFMALPAVWVGFASAALLGSVARMP